MSHEKEEDTHHSLARRHNVAVEHGGEHGGGNVVMCLRGDSSSLQASCAACVLVSNLLSFLPPTHIAQPPAPQSGPVRPWTNQNTDRGISTALGVLLLTWLISDCLAPARNLLE